MRRILLGYALAAFLLCSQAFSAELSYINFNPWNRQQKLPDGPGILLLSGDIVAGDYGRLLFKLLSTQDRFSTTNEIVLASDGGDVPEAIRIGTLLKSIYATVVVAPGTGRCVSACFLIYAAANERESDNEGLIGIHRPYIVDQQLASMSPTEAEREQRAVLAQARKYLKTNDVPDYLIEEMFRRSSKDVYWLSADDVQRLGFQSAWFKQYLVAKCDWTGRLPFGIEEHRQEAFACRMRFTQPDASEALIEARNDYVTQFGPLPGSAPPPGPPPADAVRPRR